MSTKHPSKQPSKQPAQKPANKATAANKPLTPKQAMFVREYLKDCNATQAYLRAGYRVSLTVAGSSGQRMLKNGAIAAAVARLSAKNLDAAELSVAQVLDKLRQFLTYDARQLYDEHGQLRPMNEWPSDAAAAVVGIKETNAGREIKLVDKVAALEKAMKYHGLFERDNSQQSDALRELVARGVTFRVVRPGEPGTSNNTA